VKHCPRAGLRTANIRGTSPKAAAGASGPDPLRPRARTSLTRVAAARAHARIRAVEVAPERQTGVDHADAVRFITAEEQQHVRHHRHTKYPPGWPAFDSRCLSLGLGYGAEVAGVVAVRLEPPEDGPAALFAQPWVMNAKIRALAAFTAGVSSAAVASGERAEAT
jgi:hypothetical protein